MENEVIQQTILFALVEICKSHRVRIDKLLSQHGVASGQEMFLLSFWENDGQTNTELAAQLRVQPASVTMILNRLEKAGLVTRQRDDEDLRVWHVYLTEKGRDLRQSLQDVWLQAERETTDGLSLEERLLLRRLLQHVYHNILEHS